MKKSFLTKGSHVLSYFLILLIITACGGESLPLHTAVSSITINQTQITLLINESTVLNATITPSDATNKNVSWSSSDVSVASVNQNGLVTAIKAGITTITVTTEDGNKTASCAVTVKERVYPVNGISLDNTTLSLTEGNSQTLTATITPTNATNKNVSWSSSDASVASVNQNGLVTAIKAGIATITVTTEDGNKTASCAVTVKERVYPVNGISLDNPTLTLTEGDSQTLTATITPTNATNKNVSWSSSDASVASVNQEGLVTAIKAGIATISVTTEDGNKTASCAIIVEARYYPVTGISINKSFAEVIKGSSVSLIATVLPSNATNQTVTWTSSNNTFATVDNNGLVTALNIGVTTITATASEGEYKCTCIIKVISNEGGDSEGVGFVIW